MMTSNREIAGFFRKHYSSALLVSLLSSMLLLFGQSWMSM